MVEGAHRQSKVQVLVSDIGFAAVLWFGLSPSAAF